VIKNSSYFVKYKYVLLSGHSLFKSQNCMSAVCSYLYKMSVLSMNEIQFLALLSFDI
jgi:hypothetical protein